ncbi:acyltransferase [Acetobacter sacchari]|uniref:Acyltransferase n=1 Tax=Acetobacter sacchari TaxID=2661687 RepID=A0ABS3LR29_9PROT|nr:acyltransferase [Acetobacter sacchari]MBO1358361.1 acyltransferase [Acetobacter sacchari]
MLKTIRRFETVSSAPATGNKRRNQGVDVIRGLSIILVVINHMALRIPLARTNLASILPSRLLEAVGSSGHAAVFAFFVISGFLITQTVLGRWKSLGGVRLAQFYALRAARILPCLVALVAVLALLDLMGEPDYVITRPDQSLPRAIFAALFMHMNWYEGHTGYLPGNWDVLWSLSIEEAFYLFFPLICLTVGKRPAIFAVLVGAFALSLPLLLDALSHEPRIWRHKAYAPGMSAIAMGVSAALLARKCPGMKSSALFHLAGWAGLCMTILMFLADDILSAYLGAGCMLVLTTGVALLLIAFQGGWGNAVLTPWTGWVRRCGVLSYEIYLTHMFVVYTLIRVYAWSGCGLRYVWLWTALALFVSLRLGSIVEKTFSTPARHWFGRRLIAE